MHRNLKKIRKGQFLHQHEAGGILAKKIMNKNNSEELTLEKLEKRIDWTEQWYAVRLQNLRKLCEDHNLLTEFCNIVANGREDIISPPTFQNLLNLAIFEKDKAIQAAKQTAKNMEEMERDLYLKLNQKEEEIENLKYLLAESLNYFQSVDLNLVRKINKAIL